MRLIFAVSGVRIPAPPPIFLKTRSGRGSLQAFLRSGTQIGTHEEAFREHVYKVSNDQRHVSHTGSLRLSPQ